MNANKDFDTASMLRRAIFVALMIGIAAFQVVFTFNGLSHRTGIDQAQVAREVARGNGLTTKFVRPLHLQQLEEAGEEINLEHTFETYHAPLNILVYAGVLKMVGGDDPTNYLMGDNDKVYQLDRVIAVTCALFFLIAIGINYLLVNRIFDHKIASVVAILMMLSEYMWQLTQSGLPQMLMLTLFSAACYMIWRAIELQEAGGKPFTPAIIGGFFFGLLALTHWITLWIFIGYIIFAAVYFRPRGAIAVSSVLLMLVFIAAPLIFYAKHSGSIAGTAFHAIHGGSGASEDGIMRSLSTPGLDVRGLLLRVIQTTLLQAGNIHNYLGGLIIAPAFFLALLHPFKRSSIAIFRWVVLIMWVFASVGMALYGLGNNRVNPNQIHILFMPIMAAYALALMSIIWSRVPLSQQRGLLGNLHFALIILITAAPMLLSLRELARTRGFSNTANGINALSLNKELSAISNERSLIVSDQPWAVAWYADRHAIWMPSNLENLSKIEDLADQQQNPIAGLHFSNSSVNKKDVTATYYQNRELTPLVYADWLALFGQLRSTSLLERNPEINELVNPVSGRFKHRVSLVGLPQPSTYYAREKLLEVSE